ncbi:ABC transporter permease [Pseudotabrizicola sp. 4114]|uniref:ABC transporter permease n=1 Tax=Pseudotabrizicola sp. 4114 TaxID=2817731 RepID=UPI00286626B7|nr:spermidine/putrescine transport system permease protein [Pseudorhodobacter sp. 4114]
MTLSNTSGKADRPGFWGRLSGFGPYTALTEVLFASPRRQFLVLLILPVIWVFVTHLGPILQMLNVSLLTNYPPSPNKVPSYTLEHYGKFFTEGIFITPFIRTMVFSTVLTLTTLIIMYPVAYFLARHVPRNRQILFLMLLLIPFWVGEVVRIFAMMILLGNNGALNLALQWLGLTERPIPFMYTGFSLSAGIIYLTALYMLMPLYSALEKIPANFSEAAADLGAGPWTRFRRITLPLSLEGVSSGCTLVFLISTGVYATPVLLGGPSTTLFSEVIAGFFHVAGDQWPVGAAFAVIMLLSALAITGAFTQLMAHLAAKVKK